MRAADFVADAEAIAEEMVKRESRGPGDLEAAMHRLARQFNGIAYADLWNLRYRRPKTIAAHVWAALVLANDEHRRRFDARLCAERRAFAPRGLVARALVALGDAAVGDADGEERRS